MLTNLGDVVRAVAGLLYYMHLLKPDTPDWDEAFDKSLKQYVNAKSEDDIYNHGVRSTTQSSHYS